MVGIAFSSIEFADGTSISLKPSDILVVTGPNNSGKSNVLRTLHGRVTKLSIVGTQQTIASTQTTRQGRFDDLLESLRALYQIVDEGNGNFLVIGGSIGNFRINKDLWEAGHLPDNMQRRFSVLLTARERFNLIASSQSVPFEQAGTPVQKLRYDEETERKISKLTDRSFGLDILCHVNGSSLELKVGKRSEFPTKDDYRSRQEAKKGQRLAALENEGDGIQSFTGILLAALVEPKSITLVDEAEAFLHPPQARRLAQYLATETPSETQLIVATHDYDLLRGLVTAGPDRVHVVRLRRANGQTIAKHLPNRALKELWTDPLLHTSDLLAALFHDAAVICEGDSDVRFLRALLDATEDSEGDPLPDLRFYSCGSKAKLDKVATVLRSVGVPTIILADCDVLNSKALLKRIIESVGAHVADFDENYRKLAEAINKAATNKSAAAIVGELQAELDAIAKLPPEQRKQPLSTQKRSAIQKILKEASWWDELKTRGRDAVTTLGTDVVAAFDHIRANCANGGFLINTRGELESFWPEGPRGNKAEWLAAVLEKDLGSDPDVEYARSYLGEIIAGVRRLLETDA